MKIFWSTSSNQKSSAFCWSSSSFPWYSSWIPANSFNESSYCLNSSETALTLNLPSKHFLFSKMSWRRLEDFEKARLQEDVLQWCLEDIFKTSSRRLKRQNNVTLKTSSRCLQDLFSASSPRWMFAGSSKHFLFSKTSWRRLQRNNFSSSKTSSRRVCKTSSKDVFETSLGRICKKYSSRRLAMTSWRHFQNVLKTSWKTKQCYAEDVFKTSSVHLHQDKCLLGIFHKVLYIFTLPLQSQQQPLPSIKKNLQTICQSFLCFFPSSYCWYFINTLSNIRIWQIIYVTFNLSVLDPLLSLEYGRSW